MRLPERVVIFLVGGFLNCFDSTYLLDTLDTPGFFHFRCLLLLPQVCFFGFFEFFIGKFFALNFAKQLLVELFLEFLYRAVPLVPLRLENGLVVVRCGFGVF